MLQLQIIALSEEWRRERLEKLMAYCIAPVEREEEQDVDLVVREDSQANKWQRVVSVVKKHLSKSGTRLLPRTVLQVCSSKFRIINENERYKET